MIHELALVFHWLEINFEINCDVVDIDFIAKIKKALRDVDKT